MRRLLNTLAICLLLVLSFGRFWALQGAMDAHGHGMGDGMDASACLVHCLSMTPAFSATSAPIVLTLIFACVAVMVVLAVRFPIQFFQRPAYALARSGPDPHLLLSIFKKE